jgi:hypothetical protein
MLPLKSSYPVILTWIASIVEKRYVILLFLLAARYALQSTNGSWADDFWEHAAVIRELMTNPLNPKHPLIDIGASHAFFSPYSVLLATVGRVFDISPVNILSGFGLINLCLLGFTLPLFLSTVQKESRYSVAFYTILLNLFFWGDDPWHFSGFYNFEIFNSVLPYPSTIALAFTFLGLWLNDRLLRQYSFALHLCLIVICSFTLITHSLTCLFLFVGLCAQTIVIRKIAVKPLAFLAVTLLSSFMLCMLWPYYSVYTMLSTAGEAFNWSNHSMYLSVVPRIWPSLIALPIIFWRMSLSTNRTLCLILLVLSMLYVFGGYSQNYAVGRVVAIIIFLTNVLIAQAIVLLEEQISANHRFNTIWQISIATCLIAVSCWWVSLATPRILTVVHSIYLDRPVNNKLSYKQLEFLTDYVKQSDVILANVELSWKIPALAGKVLATKHPLAFAPDWFPRKMQLLEFFDLKTTAAQRKEYLLRYRPTYLLLDKNNDVAWQIIFAFVQTQHLKSSDPLIVFESPQFILIDLRSLTL